jgi:hypothetical protein
MRNKIEVQYLPTDSLIPNPRNARVHSKRQVDQLARSIDLLGTTAPMVTSPVVV